MKREPTNGLSDVKKLISVLRKRENYLMSQNGTIYDPDDDGALQRTRLHQGNGRISEQESAEYERDFPEIEKHFQKMSSDLDNILDLLKKI